MFDAFTKVVAQADARGEFLSPAQLDAIDKMPPPWGKFASMLGYAFTGMRLAPLLGGGWFDTLFGTLFSILVYRVVLLSARLGTFASDCLPFSSAFMVVVLATVVKLYCRL